MRLKQGTADIAPPLRETQMPGHSGEQTAEQTVVSRTQANPAIDALFTGGQTLPLNAGVDVAATTHYPATRAAFPRASALLKGAVPGLLYGFFSYVASASVVYNTQEGAIEGRRLMTIGIVATTVYLLLPALLAFRLGWRQRGGIPGAVLGFVLGATLLLGSLACSLMLPLLLFLPSNRFPMDGPRFALCLTLLVGALGGVCGRAWQARAARNRKNNR